MTTVDTGRNAEQAAVGYLEKLGHLIVERNWRTRWCEIDIIAQKDTIIIFVEVKYRGSDSWGAGLDYITHDKHQRMSRAAEAWVQSHGWSGDYQLAVIEVSGPQFAVTEFIDEL